MAHRRTVRFPRAVVLVALAVLATVALGGYREWRSDRDALVASAREAGLDERNPDAFERLLYERSSDESRLLFARMLVHDVLDVTSLPEAGAEEEHARRVDRLEHARELARDVLSRQPASWRAATFVGAATYLERSARRDRRLVTESSAWEAPLLHAVELAPGMPEPRRFLTSAYVEIWPNLSPEKRDRARELLTGLLADDRETRLRLLPVWLTVAGSREAAFEPIPPDPDAWTTVVRHYAAAGRWSDARAAYLRHLDAIEQEIGALLAEGEERMRLGDLYYGRSRLLQVVKTAPLDTRYSPYVDRALLRYPAGLHGLKDIQPLRDWLRWSLELARLGRSPLEPSVLGRLATAAEELERPQAALAALMAGEVARAETIERLTDNPGQSAWTPYLVAKAGWHRERGELDRAATMLGQVGRRSRDDSGFWLESERLARARGDLEDLAEAEAELASRRRRTWNASAWRYQGRRLFAEPLVEGAATRLVLEINQIPGDGGLLQVQWDGRTLGVVGLQGPGPLELDVEVDAGLHLLELRTLAGRQPVPGGFRVESGAPSD